MNKVKNISKLEDHIGYWVRCLSNFVHNCFADKIAKYDISIEQWVVLRTLFDYEQINLKEMASLLGVNNSSLSRMIERLVKKEMVVRKTPAHDRRAIFLSLSEKAKKLVPLLSQEADKNDHEFFDKITDPKTKELFCNIIKELLIKNNWDKKTMGKDTIV
jgi:DNA-binding MarR family transcriptional regulator